MPRGDWIWPGKRYNLLFRKMYPLSECNSAIAIWMMPKEPSAYGPDPRSGSVVAYIVNKNDNVWYTNSV